MITLIIISSACFAFYVVEVLRWPKKYDIIDVKPFNCVTCLSGWTGFFVTLIYAGVIGSLITAVAAVGVLFVSAVVGIALERLFQS